MEKKQIEALIQAYAGAVDAQNINEASKHLDENFRVILNNYPASGNVTLLTREQYLGMMQSGKVGGNKRKVTLELVDVHEAAAVARVVLQGEKSIFNSYYNLIKKDDKWMIVNDMPQITSGVKN